MYFKASVLHCDHNVSKDLQELLDRQNYFTEIPKIILNNREVFRIKGIGVWVEDRGRGEGRRDRKHCKKETHRLPFQLIPCGCLLRHPATRFQKGLVKEGAPVSCPLG